MSDDSIFREVDEAIRQEQLKKLWDRYGLIVVAGAVAIVAGVGGYKGWVWWQAEQARETGARFVGAQARIEEGKPAEASEIFRSLAQDGPSGYRLLSRFQLAALYVEQGKIEEAAKLYDELAGASGGGEVLQDYARLQAATLRVDTASFDDLLGKIEPLSKPDNPWRHTAREILGLSAYRNGDTRVAERYYNLMITDQQTPANMRRRAEMMLSLMVQSGGDGTDDSNKN